MNKKLKSFGTSKIIAPDDDGSNWVEFVRSSCAVKQKNCRRFSQTEFHSTLGFDDFKLSCARTSYAAVLDGTRCTQRTDPYACKNFKELKHGTVRKGTPMNAGIFSTEE
jgi:hypothetical protein